MTPMHNEWNTTDIIDQPASTIPSIFSIILQYLSISNQKKNKLHPESASVFVERVCFAVNGVAKRIRNSKHGVFPGLTKGRGRHEPRAFYLPDELGAVVEPDPVHIGFMNVES